MTKKSLPCRQAGVKSINHFKSLPRRQAGVIQTSYDIMKSQGGEITVESKEGEGSNFRILLSIQNS